MSPKFIALLGLATSSLLAEPKAKNVILFIGDAGGIPTLSAASAYGHDRPQALFIQQMPHLALADTSALNNWTTDSAAGMTAIVTGRKTNNHMVSVVPAADGGEPQPVKTILEYAEERGLSTGVITNMAVWDATPAACYAHATSRKSAGEIFRQLFQPRFGNGVDVLVGADRKGVVEAAQTLGYDADQALQEAGYRIFATPAEITPEPDRLASLYDGEDFAPAPVVANAVRILSRNPKGFFLMVEWDMHTYDIAEGLKRALVLDEVIRQTVATAPEDTLVLFAADHSFDLRMVGGKRNEPVASQRLVVASSQPPLPYPVFRRTDVHTGEEVLVAAQGPGAERVRGFIPNTALFRVMLDAWGWPESP